ncbi:butyrophilin subfamily 1 member A1-like [Hyperolius riggenbachi]|uniref:butyrophilin subfamily 1 member A1-like n=1 Tax=Hyperolius riggenbachi TaxID=752182 RepID=UPI0035A3AAB2
MLHSGLPVLLTLLATTVSGKFQVQSSDTRQVVEVGHNTSLHCSLSPPLGPEGLQVHWFRSTSVTTVLLLRNGKEEKERQSSEYSGRAALRPGAGPGDLTLLLNKVVLSDADTYHCLVENLANGDYDEAVIELAVIGTGSLPNTSVSLKDGGIMVSFLTSDWFPEPEMHWELDGVSIAGVSSEDVTRQSNGLYRMESSVLLRDTNYRHLYGAVRHPVTGRSTGLYIHISEDLFPRISAWLYAFLFVVLLLVVGAVVMVIMVKKQESRNDKLRKDNGDLSSEVAWRKAVMTPETITFSSETAHPELSVSPDFLTLLNQPPATKPKPSEDRFETERCCLAMPPFSSDCHYWEVEVGTGLEWAVGVASPEVKRSGEAYMFRPETHIWCISRFTETFKALDEREEPLDLNGNALEKVGVYLNLSGPRQVTFYNPRNCETPLYTFDNVGQEGRRVLPFFWLGKHGSTIRLKDQNGSQPDATND